MNKQIIRNFDEFLNEEENFEIDQELDILDELDMELDEEFGYDEEFEEEDELDEEFDFEDESDDLYEDVTKPVAATPTTKGVPAKGDLSRKGDPHKMDKFKYKATLAPKLIMTLANPAKMNSVLSGPMPGNIGYKKGLRNRDFIPSIAIDFLKLVSITNPGKMDKAAFKKVMKNLMDLHTAGVTGKK